MLVEVRGAAASERAVQSSVKDEIILRVEHVDAAYGSFKVVNDVSLDVRRGETVAVVGESGSGKSTLARIITGLLPPIAGQITFKGKPLPKSLDERSKDLKRQMQLVYQIPDVALNPRQRLLETIGRPVSFYAGLGGNQSDVVRRVRLVHRQGAAPRARCTAHARGGGGGPRVRHRRAPGRRGRSATAFRRAHARAARGRPRHRAGDPRGRILEAWTPAPSSTVKKPRSAPAPAPAPEQTRAGARTGGARARVRPKTPKPRVFNYYSALRQNPGSMWLFLSLNNGPLVRSCVVLVNFVIVVDHVHVVVDHPREVFEFYEFLVLAHEAVHS